MRHLSTAIIIQLFLLVSSAIVAEENKVVRDEMGFSLSYPADFVESEPENPQVGALLSYESSAFPTFNVTIESGVRFGPEDTTKRIAEAVLLSYIQIGLRDALVRSTSTANIAGRKGLEVQIGYTSGGSPYVASVMIVQSKHATYYLTFIDLAAQFDSHIKLRDTLLAGFSLTDTQVSVEPEETPRGFGWVVLLLIVLFFAAGLYFRIRRSRYLAKIAGALPGKLKK